MLFVSYLWFLVDPISFDQMVVRLSFACFLPILCCLYRDRSLETLKLRTQRTIVFHTRFTGNVVSLTFRPSRIATASFKAFIVSDCQWYDLETIWRQWYRALWAAFIWTLFGWIQALQQGQLGGFPCTVTMSCEVVQIVFICPDPCNSIGQFKYYCSIHWVNCSESLQSESKQGNLDENPDPRWRCLSHAGWHLWRKTSGQRIHMVAKVMGNARLCNIVVGCGLI